MSLGEIHYMIKTIRLISVILSKRSICAWPDDVNYLVEHIDNFSVFIIIGSLLCRCLAHAHEKRQTKKKRKTTNFACPIVIFNECNLITFYYLVQTFRVEMCFGGTHTHSHTRTNEHTNTYSLT